MISTSSTFSCFFYTLLPLSRPPGSALLPRLLLLLRQRRRVVEQVSLVAELLQQVGGLDRRVALEFRESLKLVAGAADGAAERGVGAQGVVGASGDLGLVDSI